MRELRVEVYSWIRKHPIQFIVFDTNTVSEVAKIAAILFALNGTSWGLQGHDEVPLKGDLQMSELQDFSFELIQDGGGV